MQFNLLFAIVTAVAVAGCTSKIVVTKVDPKMPPTMEGIYYALPKTVVKVDQPIDRVERQAGKYVIYIPLFFPKIVEAGAYVRSSGVKYSAGKPSIATYGEPDPANMYYLKLTKNGPIDQTGLFEYTEQGSVAGVSAQADNATSDIVMSAIGSAVSLASKGFGAPAVKAASRNCDSAAEKAAIPCRIKNFTASAIDSDSLLANWETLSKARQDAMQKSADARAPSFEDALGAYADIYGMQQDRRAIRKNPGSFSAEAAMKDFDAAIARELSASFTGTEKKDTYTYSGNLREFEDGKDLTLLKVHKTEGVCSMAALPASDRPPQAFWFDGATYRCGEDVIRTALEKQLADINAEQPVDEEAKARVTKRLADLSKTYKDASDLVATIATDGDAQMSHALNAAAQNGERGFYYRIPATANVVLRLADDTLTSSRQQIAQFGLVASVPASVGGRSTAYTLKFYEATGALKSFNITSKAILTKGTADTIGSNLNTLIDARNKAADELTKLDHDAKVLSNKVTIYNSCKTLNIACGGFVPSSAPEE
jgi:hypothetical protein